MEEFEIEAHFSNALDQIVSGSEPGVFIALLYAILTRMSENSRERLYVSKYEKKLLSSPGALRKLDVYTILTQGITKENFEDHRSYLETFRKVRIPPEKVEETSLQIEKAIARAKGVEGSQSRAPLEKVIAAILSDEPASQ